MDAKEHLVRTIATIATLTILAAMTGCAAQNEVSGLRAKAMQTSPESCAAQLGSNRHSQQRELDSRGIRMVNWNIQKGGDPDWSDDLSMFTSEPDLMIFQEAALDMDEWEIIAAGHYRSFAPGYRTPGTAGSITGVMTLSAVEPLTNCSLVSIEPWLRSPNVSRSVSPGRRASSGKITSTWCCQGK